jgi:hypothetical protein
MSKATLAFSIMNKICCPSIYGEAISAKKNLTSTEFEVQYCQFKMV